MKKIGELIRERMSNEFVQTKIRQLKGFGYLQRKYPDRFHIEISRCSSPNLMAYTLYETLLDKKSKPVVEIDQVTINKNPEYRKNEA